MKIKIESGKPLKRKATFRSEEESLENKRLWFFKRDLWKNYKITPEQFHTRFKQQKNICACCGSKEPQGRGWCVDHDHDTNKFRGILCGKCNLGIGQLGDNLAGVQRAVDYLIDSMIGGDR